jgi:hypothetical protein
MSPSALSLAGAERASEGEKTRAWSVAAKEGEDEKALGKQRQKV